MTSIHVEAVLDRLQRRHRREQPFNIGVGDNQGQYLLPTITMMMMMTTTTTMRLQDVKPTIA